MKLFGKFPSFDYIIKSAGAAFMRFPLVLVCAMIGTAAAIILVEQKGGHELDYLEKIMVACSLGLPLFTALTCFAEKRNYAKTKSLAIQAVGAVLLVGYYFSLPADLDDPLMHIFRFLVLNIGFHALVAFAPYLGGQQTNGFWQFNKALFIRLLTGGLYSAVLYIGLAIALAALDYLFGVKIEELYFDVWVFIVGIFNTWFFLAGIPENLDSLNSDKDYPKGLKIFTQYILLPLVALYFVILISYEIKIIAEWNWPKGWVSQLVLWYAVVGILSMLLLHPLRELSGNKWIQVFNRWFFRALVPLLVMLFLAIMERISDYGFTENRYFVLAMAVGLAVVVLYFNFSRKKDIRVIPIVLCVIALLSAYGPWSAFSVSKKSQSERFERLITKYDILKDGQVDARGVALEQEDQQEMSSIINYLQETHGMESFEGWLADSVRNSLDTLEQYVRAEKIAEQMGFKYLTQWYSGETGKFYNLKLSQSAVVMISPDNYLVEIDTYHPQSLSQLMQLGNNFLRISYDTTFLAIKFNLGPDNKTSADSISINITDVLSKAREHEPAYEFASEELTVEQAGRIFDARVTFKNLSASKNENKISPNRVNALVFIKLKK